jgi:hypothetical protein
MINTVSQEPVTLSFGLQRFIFDLAHLHVFIWEVYGEINRRLFANCDVLKSGVAGAAALIARSAIP